MIVKVEEKITNLQPFFLINASKKSIGVDFVYYTLITYQDILMKIAVLELKNDSKENQAEIDILRYSLKKLDEFINKQDKDIGYILRQRYYEKKTFKEISTDLNYPYNRVVRMHSLFINSLKLAEAIKERKE